MAKVTYPQIKKIYALARELNIDNDLLHNVSQNTVGVDSISKLTNAQAIKLIDELEYKKTGVRKESGYRVNMATEKQLNKIRALERDLGWNDNPNRLKGFIKKYSNVEDIKWLTFVAASKLIEALKKLCEKK